MFLTRLISGIVLILVMGFAIVTGGSFLLAVMGILAIVGLTELYKAEKIHNRLPGFIGYGMAVVLYGMLYLDKLEYLPVFAIVFALLLFASLIIGFPKYKTREITLSFFGVFYVAFMLSFVYQTRVIPGGIYVVWLILISAFGYDTLAYCVGMITGKTIGNHKMTPHLSPKKSFEGLAGGIIGAGLLGFLYGTIFEAYLPQLPLGAWAYFIICAVGGIIAQLGDLAASAIKREYEIKDFGKLIPGHGGVMDRFDSIMFTAPVIYYLVVLVFPLF